MSLFGLPRRHLHLAVHPKETPPQTRFHLLVHPNYNDAADNKCNVNVWTRLRISCVTFWLYKLMIRCLSRAGSQQPLMNHVHNDMRGDDKKLQRFINEPSPASLSSIQPASKQRWGGYKTDSDWSPLIEIWINSSHSSIGEIGNPPHHQKFLWKCPTWWANKNHCVYVSLVN